MRNTVRILTAMAAVGTVLSVVGGPASATSLATFRGVAIISVTSPVDAGAYASLVALAVPRARCNLSVTLPNGWQSGSRGLGTSTANASGRVTWTWMTGTRTKPGTARATVVCRALSTTHTFLFVR